MIRIYDMTSSSRNKNMRTMTQNIRNICDICFSLKYVILHKEFEMKNLCARWVPCLLTPDQKCVHMKISEECLEWLLRTKQILSSVYYSGWNLDPLLHTRVQTTVKAVYRSWLFSTKEGKVNSISRKSHGVGVFDAKGVLFIDYLENLQQ